MSHAYDAVVVGAGPNGLAAAITLAEAGLSTLLVDRNDKPGGGMRTSELTLPGFQHDVCSAVHPLGRASPVFARFGLERHGLEWIDSPIPLAHVLASGESAVLERDLGRAAAGLGPDGQAYRDLVEPFVERVDPLFRSILAPLRFPPHPFLMARFGLSAIRSLRGLTRRFRGPGAPALLAGIGAHAMIPLEQLATAAFALVLAVAGHAVGWPIAKGGSQSIANALVGRFRELGGVLETMDVTRLDQLPSARAYLLDLAPKQLLDMDELSPGYRRRLARFRYGPGAFKVDWALREPVPWKDPRCRRAVTVHLSGTFEDVASEVRAVFTGHVPENPFVLFGQPSIVDGTRSPKDTHTAWAYCHVPNGSEVDRRDAIENQIERHAPGFRDLILARHTQSAAQLERYSPNYVGGDVNSGLSDLAQLFFRPMLKLDPYATSAPNVFLCGSSTPPGGGVHGMCGYWAARSALRKRFGRKAPPL